MLKSSHKLRRGNVMIGKLRGTFWDFTLLVAYSVKSSRATTIFLVLDPTNATGGNQYDKPLL